MNLVRSKTRAAPRLGKAVSFPLLQSIPPLSFPFLRSIPPLSFPLLQFIPSLSFPSLRSSILSLSLSPFHYSLSPLSYLQFTAEMEAKLDEISAGTRPWRDVLGSFWGPFAEAVTRADQVDRKEVLVRLGERFAPLLFPAREDGSDATACPRCVWDGGSTVTPQTGILTRCRPCSHSDREW